MGHLELALHVVARILCRVFGHRWFVIKRFSPTTRKVGCRRCGHQWGMNDRVRALVDWDDELAELHGEV